MNNSNKHGEQTSSDDTEHGRSATRLIPNGTDYCKPHTIDTVIRYSSWSLQF